MQNRHSNHFLALAFAVLTPACSTFRHSSSAPTLPVGGVGISQTDSSDWNLKRRVVPGQSQIDPALFAANVNAVARLPKIKLASTAATTTAWTSLGPGNVGGRTRAFLINPQDPSILYAGAASGGVWKSTDTGASWFPLWDGQPNLIVGALAMDPADPNTIYAGGGEQYDNRPGLGLYKSTDAGATWTLLQTANFPYINRIVVSPNNSKQLYVATRTGLATSQDGGATWASPVSASYYGCVDLVIRTDLKTDNLFAACSGANATTTFSVYRNTDAAGTGTWTSVFTAPNMGRAVLGIAPSQQSTVYVAAAGLGNPASPRDGVGLAGVFRSVSNGAPGSWTTQAGPTSTNPFNYLLFTEANSASNYCTNNNLAVANTGGTWGKMIAVDPLDPNRVWVGGVDLYRSDDGGINWGIVSEWNLQKLPQYSHADRHGLIFHPAFNAADNQTAYHLTDSGLFRTDNARAPISTGPLAGCASNYTRDSKVTWTPLIRSYATTQFNKGAVYPGGNVYFGGSQDTGINRGHDLDPNNWISLNGGDGGAVAVDPIDNNRLLLTFQTLALRRSINGGAFASGIQGITDTSADFPFQAYLAVDPNETSNVYLGSNKHLWRSKDWAASWTIAATTGTNGSVSAIAVSPLDSNTVIYGTDTGFISRSSNTLDGGDGSWLDTRPRTGRVSSIAFDPINPGVIYATYSSLAANATLGHVYRSTDSGATFNRLDNGVPDIPVNRIIINPTDHNSLFLATDAGLLVSPDAGDTWGRADGLPPMILEDLSFDGPAANYLFAFSFGRSAWRGTLNPPPDNCAVSITPQSVDAGPEGGVFPIQVSAPDGCVWNALPGQNPASFGFQSPAFGSGNGTAYVNVPMNLSGPAATDSITIGGQPISAKVGAATFANTGADLRENATLVPIPSISRKTIRSFTASGDDPALSCIGSAGFGTTWWKVQPQADGYLEVTTRGDRLDVFGNSGLALAAFPADNLTLELGCIQVPRDSTGITTKAISFPVQAGNTYLIETAALSVDGLNANVNLVVKFSTPDPVVNVAAPPGTTIAANSGPQTFTATVIGGPGNTGVRWSLSPPVGLLSQHGVYTPPASLPAPRDITISATSFADPSKNSSVMVTVTPAAGPSEPTQQSTARIDKR